MERQNRRRDRPYVISPFQLPPGVQKESNFSCEINVKEKKGKGKKTGFIKFYLTEFTMFK